MDLKLRTYPDPILRTVCLPIPEITEEIRELAMSMRDLMVASDGIGLAAPQVGRAIRLFIVDIWWPHTGETGQSLYFVNPVLTPSGGVHERPEGCLSLPGVRETMRRSERVVVEALGLDGAPFTLDVGGLLATAIQHEHDHLQGVTMLDRMGPTTRRFALKTLGRRVT
jgi:peptide deformylase